MVDVLVIAEHRHGQVRDVTFEMVTAANELATGEVGLVLIAEDPSTLIGSVELAGIDEIITVESSQATNHDVTVQAVSQIAQSSEPAIILAGNTVTGLDYLPALATTLDWPIVTDALRIDRSAGTIDAVRERYGSKVEATVRVDPLPAVLSLRPGEWQPTTEAGDPRISPATVTIDDSAVRTTIHGIEAATGGDIDITDADVIVSVGRGIGEEEHLELIEELADVLGATVAASRPVVDAGWLPKQRQIGQSGKSVSPNIYLAIGISGAVQHVAGMKQAESIIAINTDPNAPIFELADVGIVDDLFEVVPALIDEFS